MKTDCLVLGDGLAAHAYAYYASKQGLNVIMVSPQASLPAANSDWAQGGIIFNKPEDVEALVHDIMTASAHTSSEATAKWLATLGPTLIQELLIDTLNVEFDRTNNGTLKYTKEGGHDKARIIFSKDTTGHAIFSKIYTFVQTLPNVTVLTNHYAVDLLTLAHNSQHHQDRYKPSTCIGAFVLDKKANKVIPIEARKTILATGGLGQIYKHSTNQMGAVGAGYSMAFRIGARIMDLEYIQFHPTVLYKKGYPRTLITEAVRGEGGILRSSRGTAFMDDQHPLKSLAPRDIVARAINQELMQHPEDECVYIDITPIGVNRFKERFPAIYQKCLDYGLDLTTDPRIPVVPAAHYTCGGVYTNLDGRTSIQGLNAIGETACTGLHGANRLASTSLLECLATAYSTAQADAVDIQTTTPDSYTLKPWISGTETVDNTLVQQDIDLVRNTLWNYVGLVRSPKRLARASRILNQLKLEVDQYYKQSILTEELLQLRNALQTAILVVYAAQMNPISKGCHYVIED
jgi:L-aspartate oxidase